MMSNSDAVRRQFGQVLAQYQPLLPSWPALMGNALGVTHVPGRSGWVYVRVGSDEVPGQAYNNSFPVRANLLCMVGYDNLHPNLFQVLAMDAAYAAADSGDEMIPAVVAHAGTHGLFGGDPLFLQKKQFVPLQATPTSPQSMKIWVQADVYPWGSAWNWFTRTLSADLTARIATTLGKARYVLVSIDGATNLLQYTNGDEFTVLLPPPDIGDLIPAPPAGSVPVAAVYLPYGVTYLDWDSFFDVRLFNAPVGGSVAPPDHAHAGVAGDGGVICNHVQATTAAGQSIPDDGVNWTVVIYGTEVYDTGNEYNPATGVFTAGRTGYLHVHPAIQFVATTNWAPSEFCELGILTSTAIVRCVDNKSDESAANHTVMLTGGCTVPMTVGDTVAVRVRQASGAALALTADANRNYVMFDWMP